MPYSTTEKARAIGRLLARYAQEGVNSADADGVIESAPLLKPWQAGTMEKPITNNAGDVRTDEGQPWKCSQTHTHRGETGWNPAAPTARSLWVPYHAKRVDYALPYVQPTHKEDSYNTGEWMIWKDGLRYMANRDAVTYGPDILPDAWEVDAS